VRRYNSWFDDKIIMPIQIRPDYFVRIANIPHDLTEAEASKIAAVVMALATSSPTNQGGAASVASPGKAR